jgi:hypothetical protein
MSENTIRFVSLRPFSTSSTAKANPSGWDRPWSAQ